MDAFMVIIPQMKKNYIVNKKDLAMVRYILCLGCNQHNICICISF